MLDVLESAQRLIKAGTGEKYGDGSTIMDIGVGTQYDNKEIWVTGNFNGDLGGRLFKALERIGVECYWYDEYGNCYDCQKLLRTTHDSYHWQPGYVTCDDGLVCFDCIDTSDDSFLDEFKFVDNYEKCVPDKLAESLERLGWQPYNGTYENGWHPGQTDDPHVIFDKIKKESPELSVVFRLDEVSQFYIRFTAWTKNRSTDDE